MRKALVCVAVLGLAACSDSGPKGEEFFAVMSGGNVVPPVNTTNAAGSAGFTYTAGAIAYSVQVQNIVGVTHVGVYRGDATVNGPKAADLFNGPTTGAIGSQVIATGSLTQANVQGVTIDSLASLMRTGTAYLQVETQSQPNGEIRGQIHAN